MELCGPALGLLDSFKVHLSPRKAHSYNTLCTTVELSALQDLANPTLQYLALNRNQTTLRQVRCEDLMAPRPAGEVYLTATSFR